jgi:hypothetical protein
MIDPIWFLGISGAKTNAFRENLFKNSLILYACTMSLHITTVLPYITASLTIAKSRINLSRLASHMTYKWLMRSNSDADCCTLWLSLMTKAFSYCMKCFLRVASSSISAF